MNKEQLLGMLTRIVNAAGRAQETSAGAVTVAAVPVELLKQARDLLEQYRDTEFGTSQLLHATNRVW